MSLSLQFGFFCPFYTLIAFKVKPCLQEESSGVEHLQILSVQQTKNHINQIAGAGAFLFHFSRKSEWTGLSCACYVLYLSPWSPFSSQKVLEQLLAGLHIRGTPCSLSPQNMFLALHIADTFSGGLLLHLEEASLHLDSGVQIPLVVCWSHSLKVLLPPVLHLFPTTNNMLDKELQQNLFCIFPLNIKYRKTNGTGTTHTSLKCLGSKKHDYHS
jgi:hypothetical protein